jgi:hypothetical protein
MAEIVSRHFFRRTARAKADKLDAKHPLVDSHFVVKAARGPYRWYVKQGEPRPRD